VRAVHNSSGCGVVKAKVSPLQARNIKRARAYAGERKPAGSRGRNRGWQGEGGGYAGAVFFKLYRKLPAARCAARDTTRTRQPLPAVMACYATSSPPTTTADSYSIPSDVRIPAYSYVLRKRGWTCSRVSRDSLLADRVTCVHRKGNGRDRRMGEPLNAEISLYIGSFKCCSLLHTSI